MSVLDGLWLLLDLIAFTGVLFALRDMRRAAVDRTGRVLSDVLAVLASVAFVLAVGSTLFYVFLRGV